ncbi:MAG: DUF4956 domain-containing protein [Clostridia bacterium]|nr:DUF4956 domain-containing protein [Clostridia bacterium]
MDFLSSLLQTINDNGAAKALPTATVCAVLLATFFLAAYEYAIYRLVSHRAFYNRSFHISIAVIPFFISTIILSLQSSLVITLGTIGALAIIRFRTAVKDPVDMLYLLWSIHIGITCGCQLYKLSILTSLTVTLILIALNYIKLGSKNNLYTAVVHCGEDDTDGVIKSVAEKSKKCRLKSSNHTAKGVDLVMEVYTDDVQSVSKTLSGISGVERFSLISYDSEDIL